MVPSALHTHRLKLCRWAEADRYAFAAMHVDSEVMHDAGGPLTSAVCDQKFDAYASAFSEHGYGRWEVETLAGEFLGYTGIMPARPDHPLGRHVEIGWRLVRSAWGFGYATEAAAASLRDAFERLGVAEVLAYTAADNLRSQAVMERLGLRRDTSRDYVSDHPVRAGPRLVWVADLRWDGEGRFAPSALRPI